MAPHPTGIAKGDPTALPGSTAWTRARQRLRTVPPVLWALLLYAALAAAVFRGGFGSASTYPAGTNAMDAYLAYGFQTRFPLSSWMFPFTDWGQPVPGFTGPTLLTPFILTVPLTPLVRGIEIAAWLVAGLAVYVVVRALGGRFIGAALGGAYYTLLGQTPELFEGHVPAMVSIALAPLFFFALYRFLQAPRFKWGVLVAVLLYLLFSIGDLGMLYFFVFFAVLAALYVAIRRNLGHRYSRGEGIAILASVAVFFILILSWSVPYALGARPEYTTNITTTVIPFSQTNGQNLVYSFVGYIQDRSFVRYTYNALYFSIDGKLGASPLLPLYLVAPVAVGVYAIASRSIDRRVFYLSGLLATVFATGNLYPGLSAFNGYLYNNVPDFNAIPALFRWAEYTVLVDAVLLGLLFSSLQRESESGFPRTAASLAALRSRLQRLRARPTGRQPIIGPAAGWRRARATPGRARAAFVVLILVVSAGVLLENWVVLSEPPGAFRYPAGIEAAFPYLEAHHPVGEVLTIPFGGLYDRGPWAGVSQAADLQLPVLTGTDEVVFQAGTPYSLALDYFVGNGLTYTLSRNMTKFLGSVNVEYVLSTEYANWSWISSSQYNPVVSYTTLTNQLGLGTPVFTGGNDTVYDLNAFSGNLSFNPTYVVNFAGDPGLYALTNASWYAGPGDVVVDGTALGPALTPTLAHASALVIPSNPQELPASVLPEAQASGVAIYQLLTDCGRSTLVPYSLPPLGLERNVQIPKGGLLPSPDSTGPSGSGESLVPIAECPMPLSLTPKIMHLHSPAATVSGRTALGLNASPPAFDSDTAPLSDPTSFDFHPAHSGWGIVQLAQTYAPLWQLTGAGPAPYHLVANLGLNGWLVDLPAGADLHLSYTGNVDQNYALVAEGGLGAGAVMLWLVLQPSVQAILPRRLRSPRSPKGPP
jgi:hypothetical protein